MHRSVSLQASVAIFLTLAALFVIGSWIILLFVARPEASLFDGALAQLRYTFSNENADREWFIWWACVPVITIGLAAAYTSKFARTFRGAIVLLGAVIALSGASVFVTPSLAVLLVLPVVFGVCSVWKMKRDV